MKTRAGRWIMVGACCAALMACDSHRGVSDGALLGQIKFVVVDRVATIPYLVQEGEAILLMPSDDVSFVGIGEPVIGDGIMFWDRGFHSTNTYRMTGSFSKNIDDQHKIVTIPTRQFDVHSFELVESGTSECVSYMGLFLPRPSDRGGWSPVLPDAVEGKEGVFVQNGTVRCTIISRETPAGLRKTMSFRSIGSMAVNEPIAWAQGSDWVGEKARQFDNAALQREILDLDAKIERLKRDIQLDEEHLRRSPSTDAREQAARNAMIAAKKEQFESMKARRELQQARLDAAESRR